MAAPETHAGIESFGSARIFAFTSLLIAKFVLTLCVINMNGKSLRNRQEPAHTTFGIPIFQRSYPQASGLINYCVE
jgi:hypothetical protein